jgi:hypothetical protein
MLDELLPRADSEQLEYHRDAALLEIDDPVRLLELVRDPAVRSLLLCRLSPTVVLVDCSAGEALIDLLRRRGLTPRVARD